MTPITGTYEQMKPSGVPWLGDVPAHWDLGPVKIALQPLPTGPAPVKNRASLTPEAGYVPAFSATGQDVWLPDPAAEGPALILSTVGARCGRTFLADGKWALVANTSAFRVSGGNSIHYWLNVANSRDWWLRGGAAQPYVQIRSTLARRWVHPPLDEQKAIVRFLDQSNLTINRALRARRTMIGLLNEQKQAIIHQAVTRGLDPSVPLKPSGLQSLKEIPTHWDITRANGQLRASRAHLREDQLAGQRVLHYSIPSVQASGGGTVEDGADIDSAKLHLTKETLLVSRLNPRKGTVVIAQPHADMLTVCSTEFVAMERRSCSLRFAMYVFSSYSVRTELSSRVESATKSHQRVSPDDILKILIPFPPPAEQAEIVDFLDKEARQIDLATSKLKREIELLIEYRTRLTSDVVTGKLDVREAATDLPELGDDLTELVEAPTSDVEDELRLANNP